MSGQVRTHRPHRHLTDAERAFIVDTHATLTAVEQARQLAMDYDCLCFQRMRLIRAGLIAPSTRAYAPVFTDTDRERIVDLAQSGYSVHRIGRAMKRSYSSIIHEIGNMGGIRALRGDETSRVRTPAEVGELFSRTKHTVDKWVRLGWIASTRNARHSRLQRKGALITDDAIQQFLAKRQYWPAWHVVDITDVDWQAYARDMLEQAGGHWVPMAAVARQSGLRVTHLYAWWRAGKLATSTTLVYGNEYFIWSTEVAAVARAMHADPRTGRRRASSSVAGGGGDEG